MGLDVVLRDAPILIVASAPETAIGGMVDVSLALSYLELMTQKMGIGTCWAGLLPWRPFFLAVAQRRCRAARRACPSIRHDAGVCKT